MNQFGFSLYYLSDGLRQTGCYLDRYRLHAVDISLEQIARGYFKTADFNGLPEFHDVSVSVRHACPAGKALEALSFECVYVSYAAVAYVGDAVQGLCDLSVHLAHECSDSRDSIHVFQYKYSRRGERIYILPPINSVVIA
jgi:hypothetical protein